MGGGVLGDESLEPSVLDALALTPDMTVADVGAGTGYFSLRLARRVAHAFCAGERVFLPRPMRTRGRTARMRTVDEGTGIVRSRRGIR